MNKIITKHVLNKTLHALLKQNIFFQKKIILLQALHSTRAPFKQNSNCFIKLYKISL